MADFRAALERGLRERHEVGELELSAEFISEVAGLAAESYCGI